MYLAIEGIKGTGKSTILNQVLEVPITGLTFFPITKAIPNYSPIESLWANQPWLKMNDIFCEHLFAERAKWHHQHLNRNNIILGDRSLLTSYVTRWNKWKDPYYTIKRSHLFHKGVKNPDVIIWMECDPKVSVKRIQQRPDKLLGKQEEQHARLVEAAGIYEELLTDKLYLKKVARAQIIKLQASASAYELSHELLSIIKHYNN